MNKAIKISDKIFWLGVNDRRTHLFENYWPIPKGVAYNSYVIDDEKVAIIDTIDSGVMDDYLDNIEDAIDGKNVDYLIINHMEPDHSGAIKAIISKYPNIQIVGNSKTFPMLERFYNVTDNLLEVKEGDIIDLGTHKLNFAMIPMVHWPETMVTYESTNKVLFSGDAFGSFGTLDGGIFDYQVDLEWLEEEISRYYSNIVGKYGVPTQMALKKLGGLDINMICATHGPIWKEHIPEIIAKYDKWSKYETDKGVVIVFASMYGNTEKMADHIARELVNNGIEKVRIFDASKTHPSYIINEVFKYRGVILGSCAYNGGLFPAMRTVVDEFSHMGIKNHLLSVFGSFAWGGGGVRTLMKFSESIKWDFVGEACDTKCSPHDEDYEKCKNIAVEMANKLNELY